MHLENKVKKSLQTIPTAIAEEDKIVMDMKHLPVHASSILGCCHVAHNVSTECAN